MTVSSSRSPVGALCSRASIITSGNLMARVSVKPPDARLIVCSHRSAPDYWWRVVDPAAILSRRVSKQGLGIWNDHCHACYRHPMHHRLPSLGEVLLQEMLHSLSIVVGPNNHGCLPARWLPRHQFLVRSPSPICLHPNLPKPSSRLASRYNTNTPPACGTHTSTTT